MQREKSMPQMTQHNRLILEKMKDAVIKQKIEQKGTGV